VRAIAGLGLLNAFLAGTVAGLTAEDSVWDMLGADSAAHVRKLQERQAPPVATPGFGQESSVEVEGSAAKPALRANALTSMDALDDRHRLAPGDRLSFRIVEDKEEAIELLVTDSGELEIPYVGRVQAKGRTCKEVALELKPLLEEDYYHRATVILAIDLYSRSRGRVYVVGQVRLTGAVEVPSDEVFTVSKAILLTGGFTDFADKKNVRITRRGASEGVPTETFVVNVADVLEKGRMESDMVLEPDDLVFVPTRWLNL
jgi:protein involved in polysaccharide export with SLBB domain